MMAFSGINIADERDYISPNDPDKTNPTIFRIGFIPARIENAIRDAMSDYSMSSASADDGAKIQMRIRQQNHELVRHCVKNITNLNGVNPEYTTSTRYGGQTARVLSETTMEILHRLGLIDELARECSAMLKMSDAEQKN